MVMHSEIERYGPQVVITDPITNLISVGSPTEVAAMLSRLLDFLKQREITTLLTSLTAGGEAAEQSEAGISSLMDTWLLLRNLEHSGERNRGLYVLKSRGTAHSNQVREFRLSNKGIELIDVYVGPGTVLTGAARQAQESHEAAEAQARQQQVARLRRAIDRKREATESQITVLRSALEAEMDELNESIEEQARLDSAAARSRHAMARQRRADQSAKGRNSG
jgi:circadian clock protein KaiC